MFSQERKNQLVEVLQNMIRRRSYSGEEKEIAEYIKKICLEVGYDEVHIDKYGSVIGKIKGNYPGPKVLMDGHMDTVPVDEEKWEKKPFEGEVIDGKLYGRGTSDMKGALCAMLLAGAYLAQDLKKEFAGEIYIAGVVHEECFEGVAAREISKYVKPDFVIIGEASQLNLKIGQRGRGEIVVETFGKPSHSANPEKGINAVYKIMGIIEKIKQLPMTHHDVLGYGILELTDIKSSPYPGASVVPDYCKATYDRRLLVNETKESVLKPIQDLLDEMMKNDKELKAKVSYAKGKEKCWTGDTIEGERFFPGWLYDKNEEYIQKAVKALKGIGQNPEITNYNFCTNGSHYAGEAGIKTIGYGPSKENLAHTIDEYIELDQLYKVSEGYYAILKEYLAK
ncbi:N-formyl-4-amino-5-aminomethyl-2-methylpyrimidine deformylase [Fusobacterium sp. DD29]|uniref:YgeY family selenium metabolism-linked hydrolase n=1 Tax=unclassified Fusobacterium TaxID=2648384 RepID=UPI001B8CE013|nr:MULTISPECIES: YgeY family selenium metabolism-linked hydrolase [unclassified Fusobacterium]MBR8700955.1 N-formyl-4-amino-5-aminomethyl-2-methylpyrimidine deformylase [Fusobacterium sp. DD45]MBR8710853.1 N-formyl-4-amino-5-aminomethyl-2-methylpyrimidine deformylase [Fusobacterium sp. DD28]MBR8748511.1 N-formyl-4-amino-5-aminomethyl-2-methylpyrimidine deformylase [Fusobacterium sp. DD29]MBR8751332.1 N-formyl-4-amino-5-aminomethyl-2-methylpyrimidine deformylase [Fusobacterium sp. DD26]MBR87607